MNLSTMKSKLASRGIRLTKSLGQNFLHDGNVLRRIVERAGLAPGDQVLEIGPGLGPLTRILLEHGTRVLAVEADKRLTAFLEKDFADAPGLTLRHADALEWLRREPGDWRGWKMVSNLPYSAGSPILVELALNPAPPDLITATLQREVVERLASPHGVKSYGLISILVQNRYDVTDRFPIPAACFFPAPKVESECVTLRRRPSPRVSDDRLDIFVTLVKLAFSQRRKVMWKLLKQRWSAEALERARATLELDRMARAETLSPDAFAALARLLAASKGAAAARPGSGVDRTPRPADNAPSNPLSQSPSTSCPAPRAPHDRPGSGKN